MVDATLHELLGLPKEDVITKFCIGGCKRTLPLTIQYFGKHSHHKDGFDSRCRDCVKRQAADRKRIKKYAPPKPDACECSGEVTKNLVCDHDHTTGSMRGWIKDSCNKAIGQLGDDLPSITNTLLYMIRAYRKDGRLEEIDIQMERIRKEING